MKRSPLAHFERGKKFKDCLGSLKGKFKSLHVRRQGPPRRPRNMLAACLSAAAVAIAVVSVSFSAANFIKAKESENQLNYEEYVLDVPDQGTSTEGSLSPKESSCSVSFSFDGQYKVSDGSLVLYLDGVGITVDIPDGSTVLYDSTAGILQVGDDLVVRATKAEEISSNAISRFLNTDGQYVVCGQVLVTDTAGLSVVYEGEDASSVEDILASARVFNGEYEVSVLGCQVNSNYTKEIAITSDNMSFSDGENKVIFSTYNGSLTGAGFDSKLHISENLSLLYSDIQDEETGYTPYIYQSEDGIVKILAAGSDVLKDFFYIAG